MTSNDWQDRPVLVTGATGLLGAALCLRLVREGANVTAWAIEDRPWTRLDLEPPEGPGRIERAVVDLTSAELAPRLDEARPRVVFHLAAKTLVEEALEDPVAAFEVNVMGTARLLEGLRSTGTAARIVLASSDKAYGPSDSLPYTEDMPLRPRAPYDSSKACAELLAAAEARCFGLPLVLSRAANLYGPGDCHRSRLVPGILADLLDGRAPRVRSDGRARRDFLFVEDAVEAFLRLGDPRLGLESGRAYNLGTGVPTPVLKVVEILAEGFPNAPAPVLENRARAEIQDQWLDPSRAAAELGWSASTPLRAGLERTAGWYRSHPATLKSS